MSKTRVKVTSAFTDAKGIVTKQTAEFGADTSFDVVYSCITNKVGSRPDVSIVGVANESLVHVEFIEPNLAYPMAQMLHGDIESAKKQVDQIVNLDPNKIRHTSGDIDRYRTQASHADI